MGKYNFENDGNEFDKTIRIGDLNKEIIKHESEEKDSFEEDDDIKIYKNGKIVKSIHVASRPSTFDIGGTNKDTLFITARDGIYVAKIDLEENDE